MICLLARIYTQTDYQTRYPSFAKLVLDRWSVSSINWASGNLVPKERSWERGWASSRNAPVNQLVRTNAQVNQSLCANPPGNQIEDAIEGFHVTQVSLIITQVKNKITYHSINWAKKLKYRRRVINKQCAKVSGMCDIPNSSYSAKGITENYWVQYGETMMEPVWGTPTWRPKTSENIWSSLWLSQNVYSLC